MHPNFYLSHEKRFKITFAIFLDFRLFLSCIFGFNLMEINISENDNYVRSIEKKKIIIRTKIFFYQVKSLKSQIAFQILTSITNEKLFDLIQFCCV